MQDAHAYKSSRRALRYSCIFPKDTVSRGSRDTVERGQAGSYIPSIVESSVTGLDCLQIHRCKSYYKALQGSTNWK
jgi:hypothetical protein